MTPDPRPAPPPCGYRTCKSPAVSRIEIDLAARGQPGVDRTTIFGCPAHDGLDFIRASLSEQWLTLARIYASGHGVLPEQDLTSIMVTELASETPRAYGTGLKPVEDKPLPQDCVRKGCGRPSSYQLGVSFAAASKPAGPRAIGWATMTVCSGCRKTLTMDEVLTEQSWKAIEAGLMFSRHDSPDRAGAKLEYRPVPWRN